MKLQILNRTDSTIEVKLSGLELDYGNALRRLAISEVPTMAIDDVVIIENSSIVYDELLSHRLGLIPLTTDLTRYIFPSDCDCDTKLGCSKCRVLLVLNAEPTDETMTVYSRHLVSEDPLVTPVTNNIPILKLAPKQKVKLEAYAKLGRGKDHAKWQSTAASVLKPVNNDGNEFTLTIESTGSLSASDIFLKAIEILNIKIKDLRDITKGLDIDAKES